MGKIEETIRINRLLDIYGRLLSKAQYEIMTDYYGANLSLSEISENRKISRAAVSDALKKGVENLENYEKKVGICGVFDQFQDEDVAQKMEEKLRNGI